MSNTRTCSNCGKEEQKHLVRRTLCNTCYSYFRHNGKPRPTNTEELRRQPKHTHCINCGAPRRKHSNGEYFGTQGMCKNCSEFFRRNGRMRTAADKRRSKYAKPGICKNCKQTTEHASGYCEACHAYKQRHGKNRPFRLYREDCLNCHAPLNGYKPYHGRCRLCQHYYQVLKIERPPSAWNAPLGFCDCGDGRHPVPATHTITISVHSHTETISVCDSCYAEEMRQQKLYGAPTHDRTRTGANPSQQS